MSHRARPCFSRASLAALAWAAILACAPPATEMDQQAEEASSDNSPLRLTVLHCGTLTLDDVSPFNLTLEEAGTLEMVVPCYLVEHPQGLMLWDLGLPNAVRTDEYPMDGGTLHLARTVEEQLAELDLEPSDIDYLAMSHLHFDHAGQANTFPNAHLLLQRAEHEAGFAEDPSSFGFDRSLYADLAGAQNTLLEGTHDVFGDGRVVIHAAPGHTPGHQVLLVDLEEYGPVLLSGDLYHFEANRTLRRPPLFNFDAEQTLASMDAIEQLLVDTGAELWIQHDAAQAAGLDWFPDSYQ